MTFISTTSHQLIPKNITHRKWHCIYFFPHYHFRDNDTMSSGINIRKRMRSEVGEKFFFRKFPDLNKCHAHESNVQLRKWWQKFIDLLWWLTSATHREWDIEWKEQRCWVVCGALINDKIWEERKWKKNIKSMYEMKICWINNTWDHNEHLWWWQQARKIDFFSLIINKQKIQFSWKS